MDCANMCDYPGQWERTAQTLDGIQYRIRPIRREDLQREAQFYASLSAESRYKRLMEVSQRPTPDLLARYVNGDYRLEMAFVALVPRDGADVLIGLASYVAKPDLTDGEFAVAVADGWQRRGVGTALMRQLFQYAHAQHIQRLHGDIFSMNAQMLEMAKFLGMATRHIPGDATLTEAAASP